MRSFVLLWLLSIALAAGTRSGAIAAPHQAWDALPRVEMKGGLKVFWNVIDRTNGENDAAAVAHGFTPLTILGTYADYPGNQKEHIGRYLGEHPVNPWNKPSYFERIIRRNIAMTPSAGTYVQDIEIDFQQDVATAFADRAVRAASGASDLATFADSYWKEWASWFWLPLKWTKEQYPRTAVGIYGPQPFRRDYWGIAGKNSEQIDGTHQNDWRMWKYIEPYVDFYVASIYVYYANSDAIFYMASNVEENYIRTRQLSTKPVYAYEWLRYHSGNWREGNREVDPYVAEAMAIIPYFSGAKGIVLWGYEPDLKPGDGRPYAMLPLYMESLARVARLSDEIGRGKLVINQPASKLWNEKRPLVRTIVVSPRECIVMAVNPWQSDAQVATATVSCGGRMVEIQMNGRHTAIYKVNGDKVESY